MTASMPVILLTDFGSSDPYVGQVKGVLLRHFPQAVIIDLYHDIPPFAIRTGAWLLERLAVHMPAPAVWLCVVDPGVGGRRRGLVAKSGGSFFVGPDNGLLTSVLVQPDVRVVELGVGGAEVSATFHGRDLFAPVAAQLMRGASLAEVGMPMLTSPVVLEDPGWRVLDDGRWQAEVILTDRYGNLVTTLPGAEMEGRRVEGVVNGQPCGLLVNTFSSLEPGASGLVVGGFSTVEVVVNQGSAVERFACGAGAELLVHEVGDAQESPQHDLFIEAW